jgi:NADH:ubiquinone oxidoreductase subunit 6 (subunit J)
VHKSLGCVFGSLILLSGIFFLLLPYTTGITAVLVLTIAAGLAMTFPLAPITLAYSICSKQRAAVMATVTALASLGGMISPTMVGMFMESAGYIQPMKGILPDAAMLGKLVTGMNLSFSYIGVYLLIVGLAAILFLNPDKTAKKLQAAIGLNSN